MTATVFSRFDGRVGVHDRDLPHQLSGGLVAGLDEPAVGRGVEVLDRLDIPDDVAAVREDLVEGDGDGALQSHDGFLLSCDRHSTYQVL
ncbi:hypothetical protein ACWDR9_01185 [Streptosporangium sandarakinum]|uniref:hypothetical protein n=1 Tax=Streptosporangium sandarakinum TaxID=1260955 RepID=UPI0036BBEF4D